MIRINVFLQWTFSNVFQTDVDQYLPFLALSFLPKIPETFLLLVVVIFFILTASNDNCTSMPLQFYLGREYS